MMLPYGYRCDVIEQAKGRLPDYMANGRHHMFTMFSHPAPR
jgi:hypothetical protein